MGLAELKTSPATTYLQQLGRKVKNRVHSSEPSLRVEISVDELGSLVTETTANKRRRPRDKSFKKRQMTEKAKNSPDMMRHLSGEHKGKMLVNPDGPSMLHETGNYIAGPAELGSPVTNMEDIAEQMALWKASSCLPLGLTMWTAQLMKQVMTAKPQNFNQMAAMFFESRLHERNAELSKLPATSYLQRLGNKVQKRVHANKCTDEEEATLAYPNDDLDSVLKDSVASQHHMECPESCQHTIMEEKAKSAPDMSQFLPSEIKPRVSVASDRSTAYFDAMDSISVRAHDNESMPRKASLDKDIEGIPEQIAIWGTDVRVEGSHESTSSEPSTTPVDEDAEFRIASEIFLAECIREIGLKCQNQISKQTNAGESTNSITDVGHTHGSKYETHCQVEDGSSKDIQDGEGADVDMSCISSSYESCEYYSCKGTLPEIPEDIPKRTESRSTITDPTDRLHLKDANEPEAFDNVPMKSVQKAADAIETPDTVPTRDVSEPSSTGDNVTVELDSADDNTDVQEVSSNWKCDNVPPHDVDHHEVDKNANDDLPLEENREDPSEPNELDSVVSKDTDAEIMTEAIYDVKIANALPNDATHNENGTGPDSDIEVDNVPPTDSADDECGTGPEIDVRIDNVPPTDAARDTEPDIDVEVDNMPPNDAAHDEVSTEPEIDVKVDNVPPTDSAPDEVGTGPEISVEIDNVSLTDAAGGEVDTGPRIDGELDNVPTTDAARDTEPEIDVEVDNMPPNDAAHDEVRTEPEIDVTVDVSPTDSAPNEVGTGPEIGVEIDNVSPTDSAPNEVGTGPGIDGELDNVSTTDAAGGEVDTGPEISVEIDNVSLTDAAGGEVYAGPGIDGELDNVSLIEAAGGEVDTGPGIDGELDNVSLTDAAGGEVDTGPGIDGELDNVSLIDAAGDEVDTGPGIDGELDNVSLTDAAGGEVDTGPGIDGELDNVPTTDAAHDEIETEIGSKDDIDHPKHHPLEAEDITPHKAKITDDTDDDGEENSIKEAAMVAAILRCKDASRVIQSVMKTIDKACVTQAILGSSDAKAVVETVIGYAGTFDVAIAIMEYVDEDRLVNSILNSGDGYDIVTSIIDYTNYMYYSNKVRLAMSQDVFTIMGFTSHMDMAQAILASEAAGTVLKTIIRSTDVVDLTKSILDSRAVARVFGAILDFSAGNSPEISANGKGESHIDDSTVVTEFIQELAKISKVDSRKEYRRCAKGPDNCSDKTQSYEDMEISRSILHYEGVSDVIRDVLENLDNFEIVQAILTSSDTAGILTDLLEFADATDVAIAILQTVNERIVAEAIWESGDGRGIISTVFECANSCGIGKSTLANTNDAVFAIVNLTKYIAIGQDVLDSEKTFDIMKAIIKCTYIADLANAILNSEFVGDIFTDILRSAEQVSTKLLPDNVLNGYVPDGSKDMPDLPDPIIDTDVPQHHPIEAEAAGTVLRTIIRSTDVVGLTKSILDSGAMARVFGAILDSSARNSPEISANGKGESHIDDSAVVTEFIQDLAKISKIDSRKEYSGCAKHPDNCLDKTQSYEDMEISRSILHFEGICDVIRDVLENLDNFEIVQAILTSSDVAGMEDIAEQMALWKGSSCLPLGQTTWADHLVKQAIAVKPQNINQMAAMFVESQLHERNAELSKLPATSYLQRLGKKVQKRVHANKCTDDEEVTLAYPNDDLDSVLKDSVASQHHTERPESCQETIMEEKAKRATDMSQFLPSEIKPRVSVASDSSTVFSDAMGCISVGVHDNESISTTASSDKDMEVIPEQIAIWGTDVRDEGSHESTSSEPSATPVDEDGESHIASEIFLAKCIGQINLKCQNPISKQTNAGESTKSITDVGHTHGSKDETHRQVADGSSKDIQDGKGVDVDMSCISSSYESCEYYSCEETLPEIPENIPNRTESRSMITDPTDCLLSNTKVKHYTPDTVPTREVSEPSSTGDNVTVELGSADDNTDVQEVSSNWKCDNVPPHDVDHHEVDKNENDDLPLEENREDPSEPNELDSVVSKDTDVEITTEANYDVKIANALPNDATHNEIGTEPEIDVEVDNIPSNNAAHDEVRTEPEIDVEVDNVPPTDSASDEVGTGPEIGVDIDNVSITDAAHDEIKTEIGSKDDIDLPKYHPLEAEDITPHKAKITDDTDDDDDGEENSIKEAAMVAAILRCKDASRVIQSVIKTIDKACVTKAILGSSDAKAVVEMVIGYAGTFDVAIAIMEYVDEDRLVNSILNSGDGYGIVTSIIDYTNYHSNKVRLAMSHDVFTIMGFANNMDMAQAILASEAAGTVLKTIIRSTDVVGLTKSILDSRAVARVFGAILDFSARNSPEISANGKGESHIDDSTVVTKFIQKLAKISKVDSCKEYRRCAKGPDNCSDKTQLYEDVEISRSILHFEGVCDVIRDVLESLDNFEIVQAILTSSDTAGILTDFLEFAEAADVAIAILQTVNERIVAEAIWESGDACGIIATVFGYANSCGIGKSTLANTNDAVFAIVNLTKYIAIGQDVLDYEKTFDIMKAIIKCTYIADLANAILNSEFVGDIFSDILNCSDGLS